MNSLEKIIGRFGGSGGKFPLRRSRGFFIMSYDNIPQIIRRLYRQ